MKRIALVIVGCLLFSAMVFGEGKTEAAGSGPKTVQMMHMWGNPAEKAIFDGIVAKFTAANPSIKVEQLVYETSAYHQKIQQLLAGDAPPYVFISYPGARTNEMVEKGVLEPLNTLWDTHNLSNYFTKETRDSLLYKGKVWNIPWATKVNIVIYNKQLFASKGYSEPKSLAEFEQLCRTIKQSGIYPIVSGWKALYRSAFPFELLTPSLGGPAEYVRLASLEKSFDTPVARKVLTTWKAWVEAGYWFPDGRARTWSEALSLLKEGKAAMDFIGSYAVPVLEQSGWKYAVDFDVFAFPTENNSFEATLTGPYDAFSVPKKARSKDAAFSFLEFLSSDVAQRISAQNGSVVLNKNVKEYSPALTKIFAQTGPKVSIVGGFFVLAPTMGFQRINQELMTDFYDKPDIEYFISEANKSRDAYQKQKN
jgi:ABC-type glycerol-3-phosphate transport system substrate-binding protein